ncbi:hypothetical protein ASE78_03320 [Sphingomonas sp. Leaf25]|nr:hypothetical protein ASE78_03320 [Sphingomonas sp. Leaf25]
MAVELRLREICRRLPEYLIGPAKLLHLTLQQPQPFAVIGRLRDRTGPARRDASSRHQRRNVSAVQPILPAIEVIASRSEA